MVQWKCLWLRLMLMPKLQGKWNEKNFNGTL
jgi:hypothetical protein